MSQNPVSLALRFALEITALVTLGTSMPAQRYYAIFWRLAGHRSPLAAFRSRLISSLVNDRRVSF